jgi:predicted phosphodiesterase
VNLGDHLSGPLQAAETADLLMSEKWLHIRGNHDRQLLDRPFDNMGTSDRAAATQLANRHREWLADLPPAMEIEPGIHLCHGSPADDLEYLLEDVRLDSVGLASAATVRKRLGDVRAKLILCGHTHIPRIVRAGGVQIVNPGSIGLQAYDDVHPWKHYVETGSPHARYSLLDRTGNGWTVRSIALEYDWIAASEEARANGRADWAYALATGYALRNSAQ